MEIVTFPNLGLTFKFHNTISIGSLTISYYGILIAIGMTLALVYAFRQFRKVGVDPDRAIDCVLVGTVGSVIFARLYYVAFQWEYYGLDFSSWEAFGNSLLHIINIREGGLAIYGAIIGALAFGLLTAKIRKVRMLPLLDVTGVGFLIGQCIGRWGNFFNVEAFGSNTQLPWAMGGPKIASYLMHNTEQLQALGIEVLPAAPVHPCFLYESLWCLIGFILLSRYMKHRRFDGEVFLFYLAFYGAGRFVIEGLRTDSLMLGQLRVSQALAVILTVVSLVLVFIIRARIRSNHDENYLKLFALTPEGLAIVNGGLKKTEEAEELQEEATDEEEAEILTEQDSLDGEPEEDENGTVD